MAAPPLAGYGDPYTISTRSSLSLRSLIRGVHVVSTCNIMAFRKLGKKLFSTSSYPTELLSKPIEAAAIPVAYSKVESIGSNPTHITTLSNGLRVSSQAAFGQYSTVGGTSVGLFIIVL